MRASATISMGGSGARLLSSSRSRHPRSRRFDADSAPSPERRARWHASWINLLSKIMNQHRKRSDDANAFLPDPGEGPARVDDDLAENLAEEFIVAATSAEESGEDVRDEVVPEELGGPFLEVPGVRGVRRQARRVEPPRRRAGAVPARGARALPVTWTTHAGQARILASADAPRDAIGSKPGRDLEAQRSIC